MARKSDSHWSMKSALAVPDGSSGDAHASIDTAPTMAKKTIGSKHDDSTSRMHCRRGKWCGRKQQNAVLW